MTTRTPLGALAAFPANVPIQDPSVGAVFTGIVGSLNSWTQRVATLINNMVNGQIPGTQTNDNATAGNIGENISSQVASGQAISLSGTGVATLLTSIALTAGDWEVWGNSFFQGNGANVTTIQTACNDSATFPDISFSNWLGVTLTGDTGLIVPTRRFILASTTTISLMVQSNYTVATPKVCGTLKARRMR